MARRINLVPQSERARTTTNFAMLAIVAVAIIVVGGLGIGWYMLHNNLNTTKETLATVQADLESAQQQVAGLQKYGALATQRESAETIVQDIYGARTLVSDILTDLSLVIPDNVWLETVDLTTADPGVDTSATATKADNVLSLTGNTYSFEDVYMFWSSLGNIPALTNIGLQSAGAPVGTIDETKRAQVKGFSIGATINPPKTASPLPVSQVQVEGL